MAKRKPADILQFVGLNKLAADLRAVRHEEARIET